MSLLAGCSSLPNTSSVPLAAAAGTFSFSGRIAVREQDRNVSGGIRWRHDASRDEILLTSPLGQGIARIVRDADGATLQSADEKPVRAADAEELAWGITGWRIPIAGLASWVRGVARPGIAAREERDDRGRLLRLLQDEWQVEYADYFEAPDQGLPRRIVLTRPEFELKLVIDSWERAP